MRQEAENLYLINGKTSWVHCLRIQGERAKDSKHSYHYHEYVEFLLFLRGNARLIVQDKRYLCRAGQLAVVNAGEPHDVIFYDDSEYVCIKFLPHILYDGGNSLSEFQYAIPYLLEDSHTRVFEAGNVGGDLLLEVMQEWTQRQYGCELVIRANILKVFTNVMRVWHREGACSVAGKIPDYLATALDYINQNYANISERQVADKCGISYNHFSATFQKALGRTFSQHLTAVRIREAQKRLAMTNHSVAQIALDVGFATASHFIQRFKDSTGITPAHYRKQLRKNL